MPHMLEFTCTGLMFAMEALAADAIVEMIKHGSQGLLAWMEIRREMVPIGNDEFVELSSSEIHIVDDGTGEPGYYG